MDSPWILIGIGILRWKDKNHSSALQNPDYVSTYLYEEVEFKAIMGHYVKHPIDHSHFPHSC